MALAELIPHMRRNESSDPSETRKREGRLLRDWRRRQDFTQQELASKLEISPDTYAAYEQGRARVPDRLATQLRIMGFGSSSASIVREPASPYAEGFAIMAAIRSWRGVLAGYGDDESNFENDGMYEIPRAFLTASTDIDRFDVVRVAGRSMEPRISSGDRVIVFRDSVPIPNTIVLATSPDGKVYLKVLRQAATFELHSLSKRGSIFTDLTGWQIHGYAVAIWKASEDIDGPNIEYRFGRPLKA